MKKTRPQVNDQLIDLSEQYKPFSEVTRNSLLHALLEHSVSLDQAGIDTLMHAYDSLSTFPDVEPALRKLSANKRVDCVVFSNGTRGMVSNSVNKAPDLSPHASSFKKLVSVDFIQAFKPMPEVYKYLAQTMDMAGQESQMWLVSGNPFDVTGARALSMQAAWVDRTGNGWQDKLDLEPTVVVNSLEEVAAVVEEHARKIAR